ncbi:hypothetical protein [Rathayibacter tanaceti]|uniref:Uncharacterized protein n=2 Tax=Rathayibacter tanaceti TaxID=1671680 RepID=A0A166H903_9MICO|nr:hypothetical protein [Rathayibacter tanaceti]KZX20166.1 hypothetical protein ACH61_02729 [Rathayibacter tanaceti]QHC56425.1 hypothetical protein GSU10_12800 [Rathayibacter tanaceti]TCO36617.1 hypothetical protein EV639_10619 [Rathayibacter tanaceti]
MRERTTTSTALIAAMAILLAVPLLTAQTAQAEPGNDGASRSVHLEARGGSASTVTFDVTDGTRIVELTGGGVGFTNGSETSEALPERIEVGRDRTVSGHWSIDDSDTVTFHFAADDSSGTTKGGQHLDSDWASDEWGQCVAGSGVSGAATGGVMGAITGAGAIVTATGGMLSGIIGGALTC